MLSLVNDKVGMDPQLYKAAAEGNIEPFKENGRQLDSILTPNKNTILHVNILSIKRSATAAAAAAAEAAKFVEEILDICPSLLFQVNVKGETPLHVAAKYGHCDAVKVLMRAATAKASHYHAEVVESGMRDAKQILIRKTNEKGNTALHEAVRFEHLDVLKILTKEDPNVPYSSNNRGETPLYIAALNRSPKLVVEILETCTSPAHEGPNQMTALHAAAMTEAQRKPIKTCKILERKASLAKEKDQYGWTPLHYTAYYQWYSHQCMQKLLESDRSTAYVGDKHKRAPIHLAVSQGCMPHMIILNYPDCCELVDERGWNVLHYAMLTLTSERLKDLLKYSHIRNLINDEDVDGNTPLHILATMRKDIYLEMYHQAIKGVENLNLDIHAINKQNMTVEQVMRCDSLPLKQEIQKLEEPVGPYEHGVICVRKEVDEEDFEMFEKARDHHLIVAALIATVTFAAAFTLPGGVIQEESSSHKGTAILSNKSAFQAFVISDTIAMVLSLSAVFVHFLLSLKPFKKFEFMYLYASFSTMIAMAAMVIAFATGTYAMLVTSLGLAIVTCLIGLSFFILIYLIFQHLRKDCIILTVQVIIFMIRSKVMGICRG